MQPLLAHLKHLSDQALLKQDERAASLAILEIKLGTDHPTTRIIRGNLEGLDEELKSGG